MCVYVCNTYIMHIPMYIFLHVCVYVRMYICVLYVRMYVRSPV
jgi:hypothetical protein